MQGILVAAQPGALYTAVDPVTRIIIIIVYNADFPLLIMCPSGILLMDYSDII
ncbi:MAG: hypothetical protein RTV41_13710 [Candidatus Thorarchaeota archaeon]